MRDAFGGAFSITAIVVFLIIVNCFLAFSVNYTKAFRAKNEIRSIIEKNEGLKDNALEQVEDFLNSNKYHINKESAQWCRSNGYKVAVGKKSSSPLFCYKVSKVDVDGAADGRKTYKGAYYTVITFVNIDIPMFNNIYKYAADPFMVKGETALIYSSGISYEGLDH